MSTVRALFFKSSCSINAVFLWDLPCQRRNHQGVRSMVALFTKSLFSVMHKWLSTFGATARQKVKTGQSQVRVIGSLSCTCQMFYMQKKHRNLTFFLKKKHISISAQGQIFLPSSYFRGLTTCYCTQQNYTHTLVGALFFQFLPGCTAVLC